jgi:hypothetical protein
MDNVQKVCTSKSSYSNTQSARNMFLLASKVCIHLEEGFSESSYRPFLRIGPKFCYSCLLNWLGADLELLHDPSQAWRRKQQLLFYKWFALKYTNFGVSCTM